MFWTEFLNGKGQNHLQIATCTGETDDTCGAYSGTDTVLHSMDSGWTSSDATNTVVSFPTNNPSPEEGTASLKMTTTAGSSNNDYAHITISSKDLSGVDLLSAKVQSDVAGCGAFKFGLNESNTTTGMIEKEICFPYANTWQQVYFNLSHEYGAPYLGADTFYSFDEKSSRFDLAGTTNNLTTVGTVSSRTGKFQLAADFDNNAANYFTSADDACTVAGACTWGAWVDWDETTPATDYIQDSAAKSINYNVTTGFPVCSAKTASGTATATGTTDLSDGATATYYSIVCIYDKSLTAGNRLKLYVNDVLESSTDGTDYNEDLSASTAQRFGQTTGGANPFNGGVDAYFEDPVAWTASQRVEAYDSGTGLDLRLKNYETRDAVTDLFIQVVDDTGSPTIYVDDLKAITTFTKHVGADISGIAGSKYLKFKIIQTTQDRERSPSMWPEIDLLFKPSPAVTTITGIRGGFNEGLN
jgi:hypothetical protein